MLIKKLQRILKDYKNRNKFEIIGRFLFEYRWFYVVRPRNGSMITNHVYVIPEYPDSIKNLNAEKIRMLKSGIHWYLMNENKYRGRHYIIVLC